MFLGIPDDALPRFKMWVDMVAPLAALFIAIGSAIISVTGVWLQGRQARKAVQPLAAISLSDYENLLAVELVNSGAGCFIVEYLKAVQLDKLPPALRERVRPATIAELVHGDKRDKSILMPKDVACLNDRRGNTALYVVPQRQNIVDVAGECGVGSWSDFVMDVENRATRPGESIALLKLMHPSPDDAFQDMRKKVRTALKDHVVFVVGRNIYGEPMPVAWRRLDWFARDLEQGPRAMAPANAGAAASGM